MIERRSSHAVKTKTLPKRQLLLAKVGDPSPGDDTKAVLVTAIAQLSADSVADSYEYIVLYISTS
jgi:hypothetical protein